MLLKRQSLGTKLFLFTGSIVAIFFGLNVHGPHKVDAAAARCIVAAEEVNCRDYMRDNGLTNANFSGGAGPQVNKCYVFYASSVGAGFVEASCNNFESQKSSVCMDGQTFQYIDCASKPPSIFPGGAGPIKGKCYLVNASAVENVCKDLDKLKKDSARPPSLNTGDCKDDILNKENCGIINVIVTGVRILTSLVGVVVVVMIAVGGIQYALARDNPQAVAAAKGRIVKAILALVLYLMIFGLLQWIVPGGVI